MVDRTNGRRFVGALRAAGVSVVTNKQVLANRGLRVFCAIPDPDHGGLLGLGIREGKAMIATPRHRLIAIPGQPAGHLGPGILFRWYLRLLLVALSSMSRQVDAWHLLLKTHPNSKVLHLRGNGGEAFRRELRSHRTILGEASPARLSDVMRRAASR